MDNEQIVNDALDIGTLLGRKQAFGLIAAKCSTADVECLRQLRDDKRYLALGMNWEEFCKQKIGISRQTAERLIRNLEEFGPKYFELAAVLRIPAEHYRQIAAAVTDGGVTYNGETIEISAQNAPRLAQAVESLRESATAPDTGEAAPPLLSQAMRTLHRGRKAFQESMDCYARALKLAEETIDREIILHELAAKRALLDVTLLC
jgi:hypothetical protein